MIVAPRNVITLWRELATAAILATAEPNDPEVAAAIDALPPAANGWVASMISTLARTGGVLLGCVQEASSTEVLLAAKLDELIADTAALSSTDPGAYVCPFPQMTGEPFRCNCPEEDRCPGLDPLIDTFAARVEGDLDALAADDRATRGEEGATP